MSAPHPSSEEGPRDANKKLKILWRILFGFSEIYIWMRSLLKVLHAVSLSPGPGQPAAIMPPSALEPPSELAFSDSSAPADTEELDFHSSTSSSTDPSNYKDSLNPDADLADPCWPVASPRSPITASSGSSSGDPQEFKDTITYSSQVLEQLRLDQLPLHAASVRAKLDGHSETARELPVVGERLSGSNHILFPITFADETRWIVKIPINGSKQRWNQLSGKAITSEALTMKLIKRRTTIPIPEVLDFSSTSDNALECPYIIISFIEGVSLTDLWYDQPANTTVDEWNQLRTRALKDLAKSMAQLDQFNFTKGGRILFEGDEPVGIGPSRCTLEEVDDMPIYLEQSVYESSRDFYTRGVDKDSRKSPYLSGLTKLTRLFVDCLVQWVDKSEPFVLAHPEFDLRNVIVSPDGELLAIIDWNGVDTRPKSLGNRRYPDWLTRDWNPAPYWYEERLDDKPLPAVPSLTPETLVRFRKIYRDSMNELTKAAEGSRNVSATLVIHNLLIAARDGPSMGIRSGIICTIVDEIRKIIELPGDVRYMNICTTMGVDLLKEDLRKALCTGFIRLLESESL